MRNKFVYLKSNWHEITKSQHSQVAQEFIQSKKLSYHADLFKMYKSCSFFEQDENFWLWDIHMSVWSSMKNSYSCNNVLLQICWNKTSAEKFKHKSAEFMKSDWYDCEDSIIN